MPLSAHFDRTGRDRVVGEEKPANRLRIRGGVRVTGKPEERNGPLPDDRRNQRQKRFRRVPGQPKVCLEMLTEVLHAGLGNLGFLSLSSRNERLTPSDANY
jgi:hypothetical protein